MIMVLAPEEEDAASPSHTDSGTENGLAGTPLPGKEPWVLLGGFLPQPLPSGVAWVQPEGQQFPVLNSRCFCPSRDFQL